MQLHCFKCDVVKVKICCHNTFWSKIRHNVLPQQNSFNSVVIAAEGSDCIASYSQQIQQLVHGCSCCSYTASHLMLMQQQVVATSCHSLLAVTAATTGFCICNQSQLAVAWLQMQQWLQQLTSQQFTPITAAKGLQLQQLASYLQQLTSKPSKYSSQWLWLQQLVID